MARLRQRLGQIIQRTRAYELDPRVDLSRLERLCVVYLRVIFDVFRLDVYRRVELQAQALTMQSLLAVVPLLAVLFALFKALGGMEHAEPQIRAWIVENLSGSSDMLQERLYVIVEGLSSAKLGALAIALLAWTVMSLLGSIESSVNALFGVSGTRPAGTRLLIYWAILTLGPILLVASIGLTAALETGHWAERWSSVSGFLVSAAPLAITWVAFFALYFLVPATTVRWGAALLASLVAGTLWNAAKWGFAYYARTNVTVKDLYGSLAAFPMFILWVYVSWLLVLGGAQLCFAFQNAATYRREDLEGSATHAALERALCRLFFEVARDFFYGAAPTRPERLSAVLAIPGYLLERCLELLRSGGFARQTDDGGWAPAQDLERVTVNQLLTHLHRGVGLQPELATDEPRLYLDGVLEAIDRERERIGAEVNFRELVLRFPLEPPTAAAAAKPEETPLN